MSEFKNIYEQVAEILIQKIDGGELVEGDKLPSEISLAQSLQVARATIVKALEIMQERGYISPGERGKRRQILGQNTRKSNIENTVRKIAFLLPENKEYFDSMIAELNQCCKSIGWKISVIDNLRRYSISGIFNELLTQHFDGAIIMQYFSDGDFSYYPYLKLENSNFPFVMLCKPHKKLLCHAVYFDDYLASYKIVDYLYSLRCNDIVYLTDCSYNAVVRRERQEGFYDRVLRQKGKDINVFDISRLAGLKEFERYAALATRKFGIFAYNNILFHKIKPVLEKYNMKSRMDYCAAAFFEEHLGEDDDETLFYVPKEKIIRKAFQLLKNKIDYSEREDEHGDCVQHIIFSAETNSFFQAEEKCLKRAKPRK